LFGDVRQGAKQLPHLEEVKKRRHSIADMAEDSKLRKYFSELGRAAVRRLGVLSSFRIINTSRNEGAKQEQRLPRRRDIVERAMVESDKRYRSLVQNTSDILTLMDADGTVHFESAALERVVGYRPEDQLGTNAFDSIHPDDMERALSIFAEVLSTPGLHPPIEFRVPHKDGSWRYLEHTVNNLLDDPDVKGIVITSRDITERKELEEQLRHQAFHDSLTGLPNRVLFMDRLGHALARAGRSKEPVAVFYMDLDNFKLINDSLGHEVGNHLLAGVAERLKACIRPEYTVARLGGDEFAVLLEDIVDEEDATRTALHIAEEVSSPFVLGGREVFVTPSIGIALGPSAGILAEDLLRGADRAMYQAKNSGELYSLASEAGTTGQALRRLELESELRRAIEREQVRVCYQPTVLLEKSRIVGMEALVRWKHPEYGLLLPSAFIPVAEETALIIPIGQWVLRTACQQARAWRERHPSASHVRVWVNLSAKQFKQPKLVEEVAMALQESGLHPSCLGLEITESIAMEDTGSTAKSLRELADLGVRLAIDDFGTGYSSLSALQRLPVEVLKIDRSFISGMEDDSEGTLILSAIIDLARTLGMQTVAEGVESAEQLARLRELGCELAQGNYFSEPLPAEGATQLLVPSLHY
jgi:diguanylate cyclase (GGDEF)-like protein/PAS domain S-box-containing protein